MEAVCKPGGARNSFRYRHTLGLAMPGYFHGSESSACGGTAVEPRQQLRLRCVLDIVHHVEPQAVLSQIGLPCGDLSPTGLQKLTFKSSSPLYPGLNKSSVYDS